MKAKFVLLPLIAILALISLSCSKSTDLQNRFRHKVFSFELPYKRALFATSQADSLTASQALQASIILWQEVSEAFVNTPSSPLNQDKDWPKAADEIARALQLAQQQVAAGELHQAHETLEKVRIILMAVRERNQIPALMDRLTRFHGPMEALLLLAKDKSVQDLNNRTLQRMSDLLPDLQAALQGVLDFRVQKLMQGNAEQFKQARANLKAAVRNFETALQQKDREQILQTLPKVKKAFVPLFMKFA